MEFDLNGVGPPGEIRRISPFGYGEVEAGSIEIVPGVAEEVELQCEVFRQCVDEFRRQPTPCSESQPMSGVTVDGYNLTTTVGIPLCREISNSILRKVFNGENLIARYKIEFGIRSKRWGYWCGRRCLF